MRNTCALFEYQYETQHNCMTNQGELEGATLNDTNSKMSEYALQKRIQDTSMTPG